MPFTGKNCKIINVSKKDAHIDLNELMIKLGKEGIDSILLEGGSSLNWSALKCGIVNKVQAYIAPKILGGIGAKSPVAGLGADMPDNAFLLADSAVTLVGEDILIESEVLSVHRDS
jgi:diaminohydroxyphosphoribosylaminopyrimidine deaminase/5-amino-6-(5-phosphoribosylamino)uracil reductase